MSEPTVLAAALILDAAIGEPEWLWSRVPHPAVVMGRAVATLDRCLNAGFARRLKGALALGILLAGSVAAGLILAALPGPLEAVTAAVLLAQRSLVDHVRAVATALRRGVEPGRAAVARIVGRDTGAMDAPAVARAAIESAAENLSDGVVAPAFWFVVAGFPGIVAYKAVNTADSMIGHRTPRHEAFGWAAARLDDVLNWIPARLTAALILLVHRRPGEWRAVAADARLHRSPNAGWPEAALARVVGIAVSGPRSYGGRLTEFPWVNAAGRRAAGPGDIEHAVRVLWRSWAVLLALSLALVVV